MPLDLTPLARRLRNESTEAESKLWLRLRSRQLLGFKFRRQVPRGPYIVDFLCAEAALVVELDGGQHAEALEKDARRTAYLQSLGYSVLRFWNHDVLGNLEGVMTAIADALKRGEGPLTQAPEGPLTQPSPRRGEG